MKKTCWAIRLIFLSFGLCISSWAPLVPLAKTRLDFDEAQLGFSLLLLGIGALISMPLTGWLIEWTGSRILVLFAGLASLAILPFLASAATPLALCAVLFLFGFSTGVMNVSMNAQAVDIEIACKAPILSGIHGWFSVGGLLGALLVSVLLSLGISPPFCMAIISMGICTILFTQWKRLLSPALKQAKTKEEPSKGSFSLELWLLGGFCFIAFMAEGSMLDWSAEYLRSTLLYDASVAGIGYALFSIAMAIGRWMGDTAIQRYRAIPIFKTGYLMAAAGLFLVITGWGGGELAGFFLIGVGAANGVPIIFSYCGKLENISSGLALTVVTTCGYTGLLLGPAIIGFLAHQTTLSLALGLIALLLMAIAFNANAMQKAAIKI